MNEKQMLGRLIDDQAKIEQLEKQIITINDEWWKYADKNRKLVKESIYPDLNAIYELTPEAKEEVNLYTDEDEWSFYVRVTSTRWGNIGYTSSRMKKGVSLWPNIKGVFLDKDFQDKNSWNSDIPINFLGEKASKKKANDGKAKPTWVYVMIDKNTGLYKIGRSVKPKVREKTLQSEKPTIEMLFCHEAINHDEKILHDMFAEKRYRGEWFTLDMFDLNKIKRYFATKKTLLTKHDSIVLNRDVFEFIEKYRGENDKPNEATE